MLGKCKDEEWVERFRWCKLQKAMIKEELMPRAWHPDRVIDWCLDEEEKVVLKQLWSYE